MISVVVLLRSMVVLVQHVNNVPKLSVSGILMTYHVHTPPLVSITPSSLVQRIPIIRGLDLQLEVSFSFYRVVVLAEDILTWKLVGADQFLVERRHRDSGYGREGSCGIE